MKLSNVNSNANKIRFHFIDPEITYLNKTFESYQTTKNTQLNNKNNIISLTSSVNLKKLKSKKINEILAKKNANSSFAEKNSNTGTTQNLSKPKKMHVVNNRNYKNKLKNMKILTNNTDINKLLINFSYSKSLTKKDQINNNSFKYMGISNLKDCFYPKIEKKKSNNLQKNKKNSIALKTKLSFLRNRIKLNDNKFSIHSTGDTRKQNFSEKKINLVTDENKENDYNNNNLSNIYLKNNKSIKYIKKKKFEFYETDYGIEKNGSLTFDELSLLKKKFNLLLEEKQFYMKKLIAVEKENKKLKEEIKQKNKVFNENELLKKEIINLKNRINELLKNKNNISNNSNTKLKEINDENPLRFLVSFGSSNVGMSLPSTERYIIKLEKENEELSNKIMRYKNMLKFKTKDS